MIYQIEELLSLIGLEKTEIQAYIFLTHNGPSTVYTIAKKLGMSRSSIYLLLEKMIQKNYLFIDNTKNNVSRYFVNDIQKLINTCKRKTTANLKQLEILEQFRNNTQSKSITKIPLLKTYQLQKDNFIDILEQMIHESPKYVRAYFTQEFLNFIIVNPVIYREYILNLIELSKIKILYSSRSLHKTLLHNSLTLKKAKKLQSKINLDLDFVVFNNKVAIISIPESIITMVESPMIAKSNAKLFDLAWSITSMI